MFYYRPTVQWAYRDILDLRDAVPLGFFRELHRWGAHAMVVAVLLHMLRVFLTGSYKPPREFNWVIGVLLLAMTLLLVLHRLLAALGPVVLLGGHRGVEHGRGGSAGRRRRAGTSTPFPRRGGEPRSKAASPRRAVRGRSNAATILCPPLHRHPAANRRLHGRPLLAGAKTGSAGRCKRSRKDRSEKMANTTPCRKTAYQPKAPARESQRRGPSLADSG